MKKILALVIVLAIVIVFSVTGEHLYSEQFRTTSAIQTKTLSHGKIQYETRGEGAETMVFIHGATVPMNIFDRQVDFFYNTWVSNSSV